MQFSSNNILLCIAYPNNQCSVLGLILKDHSHPAYCHNTNQKILCRYDSNINNVTEINFKY